MKNSTKAIRKVATTALGLGAVASAGQALGGTNYAGQFAQGVGGSLPAVGSLMGSAMIINSAKKLNAIRKRK